MTTAPSPVVIGRDEELAALRRFVDEPAPAALVIEGDPGSGKTTLWEAGLAAASSHRVLACRPTEAESPLAFAGTGDLLDGLLPEALRSLPRPQRDALEVALLLAEASEGALDPRTLAVAFLGVVRHLASAGPLLIAVDDAQWLDAASGALLSFAARRLRDEPVRLLIAQRCDESGPVEFDRDAPERLLVGPLGPDEIPVLIAQHVGVVLPRAVLAQIHEMSGGNPFHALEIARSVERAGPVVAGQDLPIPTTLQQVVADRVRALTPSAFEPLLACALLSAPTMTLVGAVTSVDQLDAAVAAGVVSCAGDDIRFTHPLLAAAVRGAAPPGRRRAMHGRLARVLPEGEEAVRHLALSAPGPDKAIAAALDRGVAVAVARGAYVSAAELGELALRFTPPGDAAHRRRVVRLAQHQLSAGRADRATDLLRGVLDELPSGPERADVLLLLAMGETDMQRALELIDEALEHAADDPGRLADIHRERVTAVLITDGPGAAEAQARRAVELAEQVGEPGVLAGVLGEAALMTLAAGHPAMGLIDRAVELSRREDAPPMARPAVLNQAAALMWSDRTDEAYPILDEVARSARERGDEFVFRQAVFRRAELHLRVGRYADAERDAKDVLAVIDSAYAPQEHSAALYTLAFALVYRGMVDEAREAAELGIRLSHAAHDELFGVQNQAAIGFLELSLGDHAAAAARLRPLWPKLSAMGQREPSIFPVLPNAIAALLGLGALDEAEALLLELEACGAQLDSPWALSQAARCRGSLVGARGNLTEAPAHFERAFAELERATLPFERGRTLLAQGITLRRIKRRREARDSLDAAVSIFAELGTPLWEKVARGELGRIGGRAPSQGGLTPSELRLAGLVAGGLSNKEAAAELYVSVNTVEKGLSRIYAKLGIHSRAALAARLVAVREAESADPPRATRSSS